MENLFQILSILIALVIGLFGGGFFGKMILAKYKKDSDVGLKFFDNRIEEIVKFVKLPALTILIDFFNSVDPKDLQIDLKAIPRLKDDFLDLTKKVDRTNLLVIERLYNPVTGKIHSNIESNDMFTKRLKEHENSKKVLMSKFTQFVEVQKILHDSEAIFIESGSTLAYCALDIIEKIDEYRKKPIENKLKICTNNVSIYMILLFENKFFPVLLPGIPTNQYGATFDGLSITSPNNNESIKNFLHENKVTAFFTTSSYLDINYGPHVSSTENHLMKRILNDYANSNNLPNFHVIVSEKINNDVSEKKIKDDCKLIFDEKRTPNIINDLNSLKNAASQWNLHLHQKNNYIITASSSSEVCKTAIENLLKQRDDLFKHYIKNEGASAAIISTEKR